MILKKNLVYICQEIIISLLNVDVYLKILEKSDFLNGSGEIKCIKFK